MAREFACRKCRTLTSGKICPNCHSTELTPDWSGLIVVVEPEKSTVSKTLSITKPGRYALKVS
ncbi:MAG TPA: transcription elongation factor subunit Spt4 [Nitrososphaerales archaeon]|nr:transcription elongation factor subunit Spt4 [Nitrososphaerales archaeon]